MNTEQLRASLGPELPGLKCVEFLGSGGYADVYLYERERPRTRVAVKLMRADVLDDAKRRQFAAEADVMAELSDHPFIVSVLDAGTAPDGRPYLVMQYYPSANLAERVAVTPLSVPEALRYGVQLSSAVETAHRANIIHRDIKPSNLLLDLYGQPGLSDFGIAGRPSSGEEDDEEEVGVSIPWSSPEVLSGASNGSAASDVYSLAATIWTLLVGRPPFEVPGGDNGRRAMATRILHSRPPTTGRGDVPASLDRLLAQALAKNPAHRPQSALELARNFQRVEQELRLARTEIPVLDHRVKAPAGAATPVAAATGVTPADASPAAGGEMARPTELRTPLRVTPVQPQPPVATPEVAAPEVPAPEVAAVDAGAAPEAAEEVVASTAVASTAVASEAVAPEAVADPVGPAAGARDQTLVGAVTDAIASQPTTRRPAAVESQPSSAPDRADSDSTPRRRVWLVGMTAAAAAVTIAAVLLLVLGQGSAGRRTPARVLAKPQAPTTSQTSPSPASAVPSEGSAPTDPTVVTGRRKGRVAVFTWPAVTGIRQYSWSVNGGAMHVTVHTRVRVRRAPVGDTCLTVHSVLPGAPVSQGTRRCVG